MRPVDPADVANARALLNKLRGLDQGGRPSAYVRPRAGPTHPRLRTRRDLGPPRPCPVTTEACPEGYIPDDGPLGLWIAENVGGLTGPEIAQLVQIANRAGEPLGAIEQPTELPKGEENGRATDQGS